jgi:nucleotide-binding universal stress UspA family protein
MPRKLIIGYDGSENADDALELGAILAACLAATPLVVTVIPYRDHLLGAEELEAAVKEGSERVLAAARARLAELRVETRAVADDSPARALDRIAEEERASALVLGSAHRGPVGRVLLGSVGAALLSGAPCAIAVAPGGYAEHEKRQALRLGVAVNGSEESWPALATAGGMAARLRASLTVIGVVEPVRSGYLAPYPVIDPDSYQRVSERGMEQILERAMDRVPAGLSAERRLLKGDPTKLITEAAADFDLLILGSRGYGPVRRTLLGSVSAKLVASAPCPVVVLPRGAGDDPLGLRDASAGAPDRPPEGPAG